MVLYTLASDIRQGKTRDGRLVIAGTAVSFIWMMIFGGATFAVGIAYTTATDAWPDPDRVYIDTPTAFAIFVVMYGGCSAVVGFMLGCLATLGLYLFPQRIDPSDGEK